MLANQTVTLDLNGILFGASCIENGVVLSLQGKMIRFLNNHAANVTDMPCKFIPTNYRKCKQDAEMATVEMKILLACFENAPSNNLIASTRLQQKAIKEIMDRKTREIFKIDSATMFVRLFKNSEQRKKPLPSCSDYCSPVMQGQILLCNCTCKLNNYISIMLSAVHVM